MLARCDTRMWPAGWANGRVGADETGRRSVSGGIMGTPSSRPRSGCCGLCLLCCSTAVAKQQQGTAEREGRRAEIAIFHSRGGPGPRTNPQLRSVCIAAIVPYYANVVVAWSHPVIEPVSHALAPLSAHIHWKGKGFIGNVWRGH